MLPNLIKLTNRPMAPLAPMSPVHWIYKEKSFMNKPDLYGEVVRARAPKTIKVKILDSSIHERAQKVQIKQKLVHAHDPKEVAVLGDWVKLTPASRRGRYKRYILSEIIIPANRYMDNKTQRGYSQASNDVKLLTARYKKDYIESLYGLQTPPEYTNIEEDVKRAVRNNQFQK